MILEKRDTVRSSPQLQKVLLIDSDQSFQQQVTWCLASRFQVFVAKTLSEGFNLIRQYQPQVVLMEVSQPDGDGLVWIQQFRSLSWTHTIVVACVTTHSNVLDKIKGFRAGADDYLIKPVDLEAFLPRVILLTRIRSLSY
jgi:DNA-binding response OmpR family regulator